MHNLCRFVIKILNPHPLPRSRYLHAPASRITRDVCNTIVGNTEKWKLLLDRTRMNSRSIAKESHISQCATPTKSPIPNIRHAITYRHACKTTSHKRPGINLVDIMRNCNIEQTRTPFKRPFPYTSHTIGNPYIRQSATTTKRKTSNTRHAVRYHHTRQTATIGKRLIPDTRHDLAVDGRRYRQLSIRFRRYAGNRYRPVAVVVIVPVITTTIPDCIPRRIPLIAKRKGHVAQIRYRVHDCGRHHKMRPLGIEYDCKAGNRRSSSRNGNTPVERAPLRVVRLSEQIPADGIHAPVLQHRYEIRLINGRQRAGGVVGCDKITRKRPVGRSATIFVQRVRNRPIDPRVCTQRRSSDQQGHLQLSHLSFPFVSSKLSLIPLMVATNRNHPVRRLGTAVLPAAHSGQRAMTDFDVENMLLGPPPPLDASLSFWFLGLSPDAIPISVAVAEDGDPSEREICLFLGTGFQGPIRRTPLEYQNPPHGARQKRRHSEAPITSRMSTSLRRSSIGRAFSISPRSNL